MPFFVTGRPSVPGFAFDPPYDTRRPGDWPATARQLDRRRLGDIIPDTGNLTIVSARFRSVVEILEPGVHAFHPLAVSDMDGERPDEDYYAFSCGQAFGAVLSRKSGFDGTWQKTVFGRPHHGLSTAKTRDIYLSKPEIGGRHLFGNLFHGPAMPVFSDELMERLAPLDLEYLATYPVEAVDEPWNAEEEIGPWLDWVGSHRDWLWEHNPATAADVIALYHRYRPGPH